jgi:hypothetical protein
VFALAFALLPPVALANHLQEVDVVGEAWADSFFTKS